MTNKPRKLLEVFKARRSFMVAVWECEGMYQCTWELGDQRKETNWHTSKLMAKEDAYSMIYKAFK